MASASEVGGDEAEIGEDLPAELSDARVVGIAADGRESGEREEDCPVVGDLELCCHGAECRQDLFSCNTNANCSVIDSTKSTGNVAQAYER